MPPTVKIDRFQDEIARRILDERHSVQDILYYLQGEGIKISRNTLQARLKRWGISRRNSGGFGPKISGEGEQVAIYFCWMSKPKRETKQARPVVPSSPESPASTRTRSRRRVIKSEVEELKEESDVGLPPVRDIIAIATGKGSDAGGGAGGGEGGGDSIDKGKQKAVE